ncbi:iron uptake transporter deferrochelatase/peroxidase subunit [Nocardioides mangrovi]|uniref:Deferrochelatase n=1 Tax=Nocardioides mangrovi TaxID=2874580 RepID=A0ABS7U6Z1_9ACTN|nr:iron uptake transporter deferrochelatase/peroxidase subunit [Nocardioides mangrovi]MBZ5736681.1 deferrochelatase/peroxidase EfeB [Nocardioides mangrovi]
MSCPHSGAPQVSRRGLLGTAVGTAVGAAVAAPLVLRGAEAEGASDRHAAASYAFEGEHQAGILTPLQRQSSYVALDVTARGRAELGRTLRILTDRIRALTAGGPTPTGGLVATDADSGILGIDAPAGGLTVTVSVGASLFDDRFGLADRRPARLRTMPAFPNDDLDPRWCGGDLLLQICGDEPDVVVHALRDLMRSTQGLLQVRWRMDGFQSPPRPSGTPRNLMGFKDGTGNPDVGDADLMDQLVWTHGGGDEPAWVEGGTYHVVRLIRMLVEFWDRISVREQNAMFGRDKETGAPLTGSAEFDRPDYTGQTGGGAIRFDAHIRLASRSGQATDQRILRRSYNYDAGTDLNGNLDMGHLFTCFNQDLDRQFVNVQQRLVDEPLVDYVTPFGGGYFFALPGVTGADDWLGRVLLA